MRKIEFRAKRIDMDRWVYGQYFVTPLTDENSGTTPDKGWFFLTGETRHCIVQNGVAFVIDLNTLGQLIGMNDGNGRAIFEGDIIEIGHTSPPYLETVVFREGCFETEEECDNICHVKRNDFIAIVGNVHEHDVGLYGVTCKGFA